MGACYTVAWFVLLVKLKHSLERPVIVWAAGITVLWGLAAILFIGPVDTEVKDLRAYALVGAHLAIGF